MNKQTLDALIASAEKWERNALAKVPSDAGVYASSCKLCTLFLHSECDGCPVKLFSGEPGCANTPWDAASVAFNAWRLLHPIATDRHKRDVRDRFRRAADAEAKFLRSLIPAEGATE